MMNFGVNWWMDEFSNASGCYTRLYRDHVLIKTTYVSWWAPKFQYAAFDSIANTSIYSVVDSNGIINCYANNSFTHIYTSNYSIDKISSLSQNVIVGYNKGLTTIYKTNVLTKQTMNKFMSGDSFIDMYC